MATSSDGALSIRLGELKSALVERCAQDGVSVGAFVREALAGALQAPSGSRSVNQAVSSERARVRLPAAISARLQTLALETGVSPSAYVARLVAGAGNGGGVDVEDSEERGLLRALTSLNDALAPIGRDLSKVRRQLDTLPGQVAGAEIALLTASLVAIQAYLQEAAALLAQLKPGRPPLREQLAAIGRHLDQLARGLRAPGSPAAEASAGLVAQAIAGALAHIRLAVDQLPPSRQDRGTRRGAAGSGVGHARE